MTYEKALKDFERVQHLTYFDSNEHKTIADLCYLCLHELDMHSEQEFWHPMADLKALFKFCQKWGPHSTDGLDYVAESKRQFEAGRKHRKSDCYLEV